MRVASGASFISTDSVISSSSSSGAMPLAFSAWATEATNPGSRNWTADTLTDTGKASSPVSTVEPVVVSPDTASK